MGGAMEEPSGLMCRQASHIPLWLLFLSLYLLVLCATCAALWMNRMTDGKRITWDMFIGPPLWPVAFTVWIVRWNRKHPRKS
jgi:hypothetical protein